MARGARIVFETAVVGTLILRATRQADAKNVLTVSRAENVTMTSTSATTTPVTNTPTAVTQSVLSSVSARPDTHSTTQPSVKVCNCKPAHMICHDGNLMVLGVHAGPKNLMIVVFAFSSKTFIVCVLLLKVVSAGDRVMQIHYKQQRLAYIICTQPSGAVLWRQIRCVLIRVGAILFQHRLPLLLQFFSYQT